MRQSSIGTTCSGEQFEAEVERIRLRTIQRPWNLEEAQEYCRAWAKKQYENFGVVSLLLPRNVRQDFYNVYAYCRWSDNLSDEIKSDEKSLNLLREWEQDLDRCRRDATTPPSHPILLANRDTIHRHRLDLVCYRDLLVAFRQDRDVNRYESQEAILDYCRYSANPVGRIILGLAGSNTVENDRLSDLICTGLQLANFCQDMARDAAIDRIYAPQSIWQSHEVTEAMILQARATPELRSMLQQWVGETRPFFENGRVLVERVPKWLSADLELFIAGGTAILDQIEKADFDVWTSRPTVSKWHKAKLFGTVLRRRFLGGN
ncbi:MAG: squalene synthase HpnC [Planctomycetota bacterium]